MVESTSYYTEMRKESDAEALAYNLNCKGGVIAYNVGKMLYVMHVVGTELPRYAYSRTWPGRLD